jgi:prolyl-tRNA synthetase
MRFTRSLIPTLKENPADAEVISHKLMVRAGMLRQVARGIYDLLPLGLRVVRKVERIVREEMDRTGAQEVLMPAVCPAELWQETGRWEHYGKELLRFKDRNERDFCLGPTHEEVVTDIVRREIRSYRDLPQTLYQIQSKFRDEIRPRFGLMRGREFLMKDAYSFHVDYADCQREYEVMSAAYTRIFERCGLRFRPVEAATGAIGGSKSHEFHVLAESGEDALVSCHRCGYAANVEQAGILDVRPPVHGGTLRPMRKVATPGQRTVDEVSAFLGVPPDRFIKTLLYVTDGGEPVAAVVRGDHELSEAKLQQALGCQSVTMADAATVEKHSGAAVGFAGPIGLRIRVLADRAIGRLVGAVAGANETDQHLVDVAQERDLPGLALADLRIAQAGDPCVRCPDGVYEGHRGIEVGQVFYLGTKYSQTMKATYLDANGEERFMEMGCYGIGITRTAAAAIEQNHDENGIIWPLALAPAHVHLIAVNPKEPAQQQAAERLYAELTAAGVEVLYDDREERPGVKFKDADLIGVPLRVTVGPKALARGAVELKGRRDATAQEIPFADAVERLTALVREGGAP